MAGFQPYSNREWVWFEHRLKHDLKGPSYAMRSIKNQETCRDDKKRALSCVALKKKKGSKKSVFSYLRFLPSAPAAARPALEEKISKAGKDRGRERSILFSLRELPDQRSIRNRLRVHFVGRKAPIHSGLQRTQKQSLLT